MKSGGNGSSGGGGGSCKWCRQQSRPFSTMIVLLGPQYFNFSLFNITMHKLLFFSTIDFVVVCRWRVTLNTVVALVVTNRCHIAEQFKYLDGDATTHKTQV